jgi:hypothetical protein
MEYFDGKGGARQEKNIDQSGQVGKVTFLPDFFWISIGRFYHFGGDICLAEAFHY